MFTLSNGIVWWHMLLVGLQQQGAAVKDQVQVKTPSRHGSLHWLKLQQKSPTSSPFGWVSWLYHSALHLCVSACRCMMGEAGLGWCWIVMPSLVLVPPSESGASL